MGAELNKCRVQRVPNFAGAEFDQRVPGLNDPELTGCRVIKYSLLHIRKSTTE